MVRLLLVSSFLFISHIIFSQSFIWDVGGAAGATMYIGEISGTEATKNLGPLDLAYRNTRYSISGFARRHLSYRFFANFALSYVYLYGHDKNSIGTWRVDRNLSFYNHVMESTASLEYHFLRLHDLGGTGRHVLSMDMYFAAGFGFIYQNPKAEINGQNVALAPLRTEGQDSPASAIQFVVPITGGMYFTFKGKDDMFKTHRVGIYATYRYTYFDYLDDISTKYPDISEFDGDQMRIDASYRGDGDYPAGKRRGSPTMNDHYATIMLMYSKRLFSSKKSRTSQRVEEYGKPKKRKSRKKRK